MKAEIELECKRPQEVIRSIRPDVDDMKFRASIKPGKGKLNLSIESRDIAGLLAGIGTYMRLIRVAIEATEI